MLRSLIASVFAVLLLMTGAVADEVPAPCKTPDALIAELKAQSPDSTIQAFTDKEAVALTDGISAFTGAHLPIGGTFIVQTEPYSAVSYIVLFINGCAEQHGRLPTQLVQAWLGLAS